ncbi:MAG: universal stress protein [Anaerolineaceae bacterium]|jgi:nucleotide-binding universal stress UspA family protein|nr:universal stress protein [Anaerolineaceae bacterium]
MNRNSAINDFHSAHRKASLKSAISQLTGEKIDLLSYDQVLKSLRLKGQVERGMKEIPLDKIIGSVGRYSDFTRDFLPRKESDSQRWASVKMATESMLGVPPIEVYKVGDYYFVRDGNHRVSIARSNGQRYIEAYITEVMTRVPLTGDVDLDNLIIKEEFANFLEITQLDKLISDLELNVTEPGGYDKLLDHINVHRYFMGKEQNREIPYLESAIDWYQNFYLPTVEIISEKGLLREFPDRTKTDLYLWMLEHRGELEGELGWRVDTTKAAESLAARFSSRTQSIFKRLRYWLVDLILPDNWEAGPRTGTWRKAHRMQIERKQVLFPNLLLAIQDNLDSRDAFEQALWIAQREGARISAIHLVASAEELESDKVKRLREIFYWRLGETGVQGSLAIEVGEPGKRILERAFFTDMVIVKMNYAPGIQPLQKLRSGFRTLVRKTPQPLLVVPGFMRPVKRLLLAYDGSPKGKEAMYIAAYLAIHWKVELYILTTYRDADQKEEMKKHINKARSYMRFGGVFYKAHLRKGLTGQNILNFVKEKNVDMVIMGSYGSAPIKEVMSGSTIDYVLDSIQIPVLICK